MPGEYELLRSVLSDRIIAFHPVLARRLGGINEALLFQQIAFWSGKGADPEWIYKTQAELEEETTLSRYQQEQARSRLRKLGVLEETKRGLPAKLYYRINWPVLFALLETAPKDARNSQPRMREGGNQGCEEVAVLPAENSLPITETTTKRKGTDLSNNSTGLSGEDFERLTWYVEDAAREFNDQAPLTSTVTRMAKLYDRSGLSMEEFLDRLQQARLRTKRYTGSIRATANGKKTKTAYWIAIIEELVAR